MHHYINAITNKKGDALSGYFVRCVDSVTGSPATLYADTALTPILSVSGVANAAKVDADGNVSFYIATGSYHLDIYATDSTTFVRRIQSIPMVEDLSVPTATTIGLFTNASSQVLGSSITLVQTTGYSALDKGAAIYAYDATVDSAYVTANPRTSFLTSNGRGFKLSKDQEITPLMLGATADAVADDSAIDTAARTTMKNNGGGVMLYPPATGYKIGGKVYKPGLLIESDDFPTFSGAEPNASLRVYARNTGAGSIGRAGVYSFMVNGTGNMVPFSTIGGTDSVPLSGVVYSGGDAPYPVCVGNIVSRYAGLPVGLNWGLEIDMNNESATAYTMGDPRGGQGLVFNTGSTYSPDTAVVIQRSAGEGTGPGWKQGMLVKGVRSYGVVVEAMSTTSAPGMSPAATGTITAFAARVGGDSQNRFEMSQDGQMFWGSGSGATDVNLSRNGANSLGCNGAFGASSLGFNTGVGGTVTQATSRTTGVTLNKVCGQITLVSAAGSATWQSFTVTNSTVAATDTVRICQASGADLYQIHVTNIAAGSFKVSFATTGGTTTEQPVFNFSVIKGVAA